MGLLTKFGLGGGGKATGSTQARFMKVLDTADLGFVAAADMALTVGLQWYKLGAGYTVPAQQMVHLGYGSAELPDNQGYLYIHLPTDTPSEINGKVRLVQSNAQETVKFVVAEFNLASTHGSVTNKAMMIPLPEQTQFPLVGEDSMIWLEAARSTVDAYDTVEDDIDVDTSVVYIPVTIYM